MDARPLLQSLCALAEDNAAFFQRSGTASGSRFAAAFRSLAERSRALEPSLRRLSRLCPRFDLDERTPGNGYRSLVHTVRCCLAHALHKSRYVAAHRGSVFFRHGHNAAELEAYGAALAQLGALLGLAEKLVASSQPGCLFPPEEAGMGQVVLREYSTMRNGCFYGRCLGFQFAPSLRPLLQAIAIGLVSFGENYKPNDTGLGVAAGSLFTSGKFALDPELRGDEFERLTQNLDVQFWKRFWNLTETQLLASVASMAAAPVGLCRALSVPPEPLELPLHGDPAATVTIAPPVAHTGPAPVRMRLLSYHLRDGQDSAALLALSRSEGPRGPLRWLRGGPALPPSPALLLHFHGGGFVAQTSRSHEPYLRGWARELGAPVLSVDYALAPEAPFPRALEECFYAYCWALRNCRLLGSTAQRVCLAGDSAGGNLCLSVSLRAAAVGVRPPQGIVAAYPVTLVQAAASPSRLLTLLDPLLPISVLCQCLRAYAGADEDGDPAPPAPPALEPLTPPRLLLRDLRRGAAQWLGGLLRGGPPKDAPPRKSLSEQLPPPDGAGTPPNDTGTPPNDAGTPQNEGGTPGNEGGGPEQTGGGELGALRTRGPPARFLPPPAPLARNPFMSPLLAPESLLGALPPVHLVACALDPMLDDSVSLARRLRDLGRPVTLHVVPDLPHGFLSLGALSPETRRATALCTRLIRAVLHPPDPHLGGRRASAFLGGRRDSLDPHLGGRRGSVMLGTYSPQDGARRGSGVLGTRSDSPDPHLGGRRGSAFLGGRRDSVDPHLGGRRGSAMLGTHRDSLDPHLGGRRGSVMLGTHSPQDGARRGSAMLGTHRESPDPHLGGRRGSVLLGGRRDSSAPQDGSCRGSVMLGTHRDSPDPHLGGRRGSVLLGGQRDKPVPHSMGGATHSAGAAAKAGGGDTETHGNGAALPHSDGAALPHSTSQVLTYSDGTTETHGNGAALPHSDGATLPHSTSKVLTHSDGAALPHSDGATLPHSTSKVLTHSDGAALPHSTSKVLTHSNGAALPHSDGAALPHSTSKVLTHSDGAALPHSTSKVLTHSDGTTETHGNGAALPHSDGATLPHSTSKVLTHSNGAALPHSDGATLPHSTSKVLTHSNGAALPHSDGAALPQSTSKVLTHSDGAALPHSDGAALPHSPSPTPPPPSPAQPHIGGAPPSPPRPPPCCGAPPGPPRDPPNPRRPSGPAGREVGS